MGGHSGAKDKGSGQTPPLEVMVWAFMAIAVGATLWFLMHEPEDGVGRLSRGMEQMRLIALASAVFGAAPGVWHIVRRDGRRNLFAMAVLFNVVLACFWVLRLALAA